MVQAWPERDFQLKYITQSHAERRDKIDNMSWLFHELRWDLVVPPEGIRKGNVDPSSEPRGSFSSDQERKPEGVHLRKSCFPKLNVTQCKMCWPDTFLSTPAPLCLDDHLSCLIIHTEIIGPPPCTMTLVFCAYAWASTHVNACICANQVFTLTITALIKLKQRC